MNDQTFQGHKIGVVAPDVLLSYDGLSFLKAMIAGELPAPPIMQTIGFMLSEVESGRALFRGTPEFRHYNPIGSIHAGFAATLLDSAMACAVHSTLAKGEAYTTLEFKLNLVRALTDQVGPVAAEGVVLHRGRTIATAEGYLKDAGGKLYAHANTTCVIFPAKAA